VSDLPAAEAALARATGRRADVDPDARRASAPVDDRLTALAALLRDLEAWGIEAEDVGVRRPTLDEVFLHLTGHPTNADTDTTTEEEAA
jgi:ABC-2 type transport system ATP-binding protein